MLEIHRPRENFDVEFGTVSRLNGELQDPVATHSVVAAAHQILIDPGAQEDIHSIVKGPRAQRDRQARLNCAANYFKHADSGADGKINIAPSKELTAEFLMDSVYLLQRISKQFPLAAKIYWHWFVKTRPELFEGSGPELDHMIAAEYSTNPDELAQLVRLIWAVGEDQIGEFWMACQVFRGLTNQRTSVLSARPDRFRRAPGNPST